MRRVSRRLTLTVLAGAIIASAGTGVGLAVAGASTSHGPRAEKYGGLPAFLPKTTVRTDAIVTGDASKPAITSEGDSIKAVLPSGRSVDIVVSGPQTPGEGLPFQALADTATWTVTMSHASARVPVSLTSFSAIDSLGKVYHLLAVPGHPTVPRVVRPGQTVTFQMRVVMRVGEGDMRWAPTDNDLLATWDFVVEND